MQKILERATLKAILGTMFTTLLLCMIVFGILTPCALATDYSLAYYDGDWTNGSHSSGGWGVGAHNAGHDTAKGKLRVFTHVTGVGSFSANAEVYKDFVYSHPHDYVNTFKIRYQILGIVDYVGANNRFYLKIELWDRTSDFKVTSKTPIDVSCDIFNPSYRPDEYQTQTFKANLQSGHTYRVKLKIRAEVSQGGLGLDSAQIDFFTIDLISGRPACVDWSYLKIYHTAHTITTGGSQTGTAVHAEYDIIQDAFAGGATQLEFTSYNDDVDINGWSIDISRFTSSSSTRDGNRAIDVQASGTTISKGDSVNVAVTQWVDEYNTMGIKDANWIGSVAQAIPDHQWSFGPSTYVYIGRYRHRFTITNDDLSLALNVTGLSFIASATHYSSLSEISYNGPTKPNFLLNSGQSKAFFVYTGSSLVGGYIYFTYNIYNQIGGDAICNAWGGHPVTEVVVEPGVGGVWVPVDKFGLFAPYIGLASTIIVATVGTAIYVKRVKRRREKQ